MQILKYCLLSSKFQLHVELEKEFGNLSVFDDEYEDDSDDTGHSPHHHNRSLKNNQLYKDFPLRDEVTRLYNLVESKDRELQEIYSRQQHYNKFPTNQQQHTASKSK